MAFDPDAIAESSLALVGLDGLAMRNPFAVFRAFGVKVTFLPSGELRGYWDLQRILAAVACYGCDRTIMRSGSHECGHMLLSLARVPLPHDEDEADAVGRAVCMGRWEMLRRLRRMGHQEVIDSYKAFFLESEIVQRIWEVRRPFIRVGIMV